MWRSFISYNLLHKLSEWLWHDLPIAILCLLIQAQTRTVIIFGPLNHFSSGQFSCSVMSNSLLPREPQRSRPPCPSPTAWVYPNPCPFSRWCHPTISFSVISFPSRLQSFPASGSFPMSWYFPSGGQSIGVSASASVLEFLGPISFRMDWLDLLNHLALNKYHKVW